ncbi:hypothetical protein D3C76_1776160 [compost metagenome]
MFIINATAFWIFCSRSAIFSSLSSASFSAASLTSISAKVDAVSATFMAYSWAKAGISFITC